MNRKRFLIGLVLIALLVPAAMTIVAQETTSTPNIVPPGERDAVALTIYNQGTALVVDRRTYDLNVGVNLLNFVDVAAGIDPTSVQFNSLTDPEGTVVLEQSYVYDLVDSSALLNRYLDQTIEVVTTDGTEYRGQLLSGRGGEIILRDESGQVIVVSPDDIRDLRFPEL